MSLVEELHRARKERLARMQPRPKVVEPKIEVRSAPAVEFDTMEAWLRRQKSIPLPVAKEPWFSVVDDFEIAAPTIGKIQFAVAQHFNVSRQELLSRRKTAGIVYPRHIAFFLCKTLTLRSLPEIGRRFGDRDHTTILHGVRKIAGLVKTDWTVAYDVAHAELLV